MEAVSNWVKNLLIIVLISTFLELFLPDNNLRKYVRVVMGFFIISLFLSPLTMIMGQNFTVIPLEFSQQGMEERWQEIREQGQELSENNNSLIDDQYRQRLIERVKSVVNLSFPGAKVSVESELDEYFQPRRIKVYIDNSQQIQEIRIGEEKEEAQQKLIEKLQKVQAGLSQMLQLPAARIDLRYMVGDDIIEDF